MDGPIPAVVEAAGCVGGDRHRDYPVVTARRRGNALMPQCLNL
jgi:hypothetical protein